MEVKNSKLYGIRISYPIPMELGTRFFEFEVFQYSETLIPLGSSSPNYVVLITDGWQWCDPYDSSTRFLPVEAVEQLSIKGITTYVVGFGTGVDHFFDVKVI